MRPLQCIVVFLNQTKLIIRRSQKEDFNALIHWVRINNFLRSRFTISLYSLQLLFFVTTTRYVDYEYNH